MTRNIINTKSTYILTRDSLPRLIIYREYVGRDEGVEAGNVAVTVTAAGQFARSPPQQPWSVSRMIMAKKAVETEEEEVPLDVRVCKEEMIEGKIE